ncbi:pilus assembly protein TadG-related protein [Pseudarthrobacter sulfonivorans]|uniref:pilus assembly protein TadG-related protein n=1 Tax=Pseudarthrobacter sulfonivorans TaxID=121292 RepID=UPI00210295EF|nr:TadE/TadG family type IV pilus assembly protein [Pseudarthrobacter sulfonivorans]
MWRVTADNKNETGAVAVIVAILLVVLLGFVALAVDVGVISSERAQLQNGADAAAIGIAQECARSTTSTVPSPLCSTTSTLATDLANRNALDGKSTVRSTDLSTPGKVTVTTVSKEDGAPADSVSLYFARALGINSAKPMTRSSAQWGTPTKGPAILPLAVAACKFDIPHDGLRGTLQVLEQGKGCGSVPGGFGWLPPNPGTCTIVVGTSSEWFGVNTGASAPTSCSAADFSKVNNKTVLLPVYDLASGTGKNAAYYIKGFAAFHVTGYQFANIGWTAGPTVDNKSITGYFEKFVSLDQAFELGSSPYFGASVVRPIL